jgi:hypothetical protein
MAPQAVEIAKNGLGDRNPQPCWGKVISQKNTTRGERGKSHGFRWRCPTSSQTGLYIQMDQHSPISILPTIILMAIAVARATNILVAYNPIHTSVIDQMYIMPSFGGKSTILYNYMEGVACNNAGHCHFINQGYSPLGTPSTVNTQDAGYNTFLQNNTDCGRTAILWQDLFRGPPVPTVTNTNQYNNVIVANDFGTAAGGGGGCALCFRGEICA